MQNICGAFSGAVLVISYYCCGGAMDASTKAENFEAIQQAAALFKKEYGSVICRAILRGEKPQPHKCGEKIENAVRIIETILDKKGEKTC